MSAGLGLPKPLGFPNCLNCAFLVNGPVRVCTACAGKTLTPVPAQHCEICSQDTSTTGHCNNGICSSPTRAIESVGAVAMYTDPLKALIYGLKENPLKYWSFIFGRLVFGWLDRNVDPSDVDLVIPNPTFRADGGLGHTESVVAHAGREDAVENYGIVSPFDPILVKARETPKSKGNGYLQKLHAAQLHTEALEFPRGGEPFHDRRVIIYDDVLTTGAQFDAVARLLKDNGAASVKGLVLARTPWRYY